MKKLFTILLISALFTTNFFAQDKHVDLNRLFDLMQVGTEQISSVLNKDLTTFLELTAKSKTLQNDLDEELKKYINDEVLRFSQIIMTDVIFPAYDSIFTETDITNLIHFFETPTGKKFIEKDSEIKTLMSKKLVNQYFPELLDNVNKTIDELSQ